MSRKIGEWKATDVNDGMPINQEIKATPQDIRERLMEQDRRFLSLQRVGKLTRQWENYGTRHRSRISRVRRRLGS